jgi:hypothetical protein
MKKLLVSICIVCLAFTVIHAQSDRPFRLGILASPSLSWFKPDTRGYESEGNTLGFTYGIIGDFFLGDYYAVSTGLNISHFGGKLSFSDNHATHGALDIQRKYIHQYLELPLTLKMQTPEIGYSTYYVRFGFAPGINLKAKGEDQYSAGGSRFTEEIDLKSRTPFLRAALIVGLGVEYSLGGKTSLMGGVTYNNGFTNNLKGRNTALNVNPSATASLIQLNLGVMF